MLEFKNKTALITGGGSGIGEAMAYQYAKKGTNAEELHCLRGKGMVPYC